MYNMCSNLVINMEQFTIRLNKHKFFIYYDVMFCVNNKNTEVVFFFSYPHRSCKEALLVYIKNVIIYIFLFTI
jgi:hypothetical protein